MQTPHRFRMEIEVVVLSKVPVHHVRINNWWCFSGVLSSNSYRQLTTRAIFSHVTRGPPRSDYCPHTFSHQHHLVLLAIVYFRLQSCSRNAARRLRSSVHRRNSHGAVTQPWQIPTTHRIHVHPNVHHCETPNELL